MRYLSKWRLFLSCREQVAEAYANGIVRVIQEPIMAVFDTGGVTPNERELALASFTFEGSYQELDEATMVAPDYRITVYDTDLAARHGDWSAETKRDVEAVLSAHAQRYNYILEVPRTFVEPPWPRYAEYKGTPASLVRKLVDEGHNLEEVLQYERDTQNREPVIEAIERALVEAPVEEEVVG